MSHSYDPPSPIKDSDVTANRPSSSQMAPPASNLQLLYASIIEGCDDAIFAGSLDGRILTWNPGAEALYGYCVQEMLCHTVEDIVPPERLAEFNAIRKRVHQGQHESHYETVHQHKDGSLIDVSINFAPVRSMAGVIIGASMIVRNITRQKEADEALRRSEERFALAARGANDGLWDWNLETDLIYFSARWKQMLGYDDQETTAQPHEWFGRVSSKDLHQLQADIAFHLAGQTPQLKSEFRIEHSDGELRWMLCRGIAIRDEQDEAIRVTGWFTDIHDQKLAEEQLRYAAQHDKLTHLPNRELFLDRVNSAIKRGKRNLEHHYAVLFLDFDRFKIVNDSLGHDVGDQLLISIAGRLKALIRGVDTAARLGGDEFTVLLDGLTQIEDAKVVAGRMLELFAAPHVLDHHEVTSTASIGIVTSDENYESAEVAIRDADTAMYQAKQAGRGRFVMFDDHMHQAAVQRLELEKDLRKALLLNQFRLHYQPVLCLETGRTVGFESLIRWQHPTRGFISPDEFITIAEEINVITPIGEWVLNQSCAQLALWSERFNFPSPLTINVNVSKIQLFHPQMVQRFCDIIDNHNVSRSQIKLEITESAIMDDRSTVTPVLRAIHEAGIPLAMDDFGTGHSSLSCLHNFPITVLKIDRSFIENMDERTEFTAVVQAIVTLAHTLGVSVVAEGIETAEQLALLQALECDQGQGYLFAKPLPADKATQYLVDSMTGRDLIKRSA